MIGSGEWVLVRKGRPPIHFPSLEAAHRVHDLQRFNRGAEAEATVFGPGGKEYHCGRERSDAWVEIIKSETIDG